MQEKKITLEIKKINKKENVLEWTQSMEIDQSDSLKKIQETKPQVSQTKEKPLMKENNPFYQPSMNTVEFQLEDSNSKTTINLYKNNQLTISDDDCLLAIDSLLEKKIISVEEYENLKKQIK